MLRSSVVVLVTLAALGQEAWSFPEPAIGNVAIPTSNQTQAVTQVDAGKGPLFDDHDHDHEECGTEDVPIEVMEAIELKFQSVRKAHRARPTRVHVPMVFHVYDGSVTDQTIAGNVEKLNYEYQTLRSGKKDTGLTFHTAVINRYPAITFDPTKSNLNKVKKATSVDPEKYLNVWIVPKVKSDSGKGICGYSSFPWDLASQKNLDGFICATNCFSISTFPHELGHWLGLLHTFQGGCTGSGDGVDDTPAQLHTSGNGCKQNDNTCPEPAGTPPVYDHVRNFMSYSDKSCRTEFTKGQEERMWSSLESYRSNLFKNEPAPSTWKGYYDHWIGGFPEWVGVYARGKDCLPKCEADPTCKGVALHNDQQHQCYKYEEQPWGLPSKVYTVAEMKTLTPSKWSTFVKVPIMWKGYYDHWVGGFPEIYARANDCLPKCEEDPTCKGVAFHSSLQHQCYKYNSVPGNLPEKWYDVAQMKTFGSKWSTFIKA